MIHPKICLTIVVLPHHHVLVFLPSISHPMKGFLFGGRTRASIGVPHAWLQHVYADYMQTSTGVIEVYELTKNKANGPLL